MTIAITRTDLDGRGLMAAATRAKDAAAARRMLALALVLEGRNRTEAARLGGIQVRWVAHGVFSFHVSGPVGSTRQF